MPKPQLPEITVITCVKNSAETLAKAIESVAKQNYPNLKYYILDGVSTDGTIDVIKKYEKNISYWQSKADGGNVEAYIAGIKLANSEIICFLNADDFYEDDILLKVGTEFLNNPSLDLVSCRYRVINPNHEVIEEVSCDDIDIGYNKTISALGINARFFKKNLFERFGLPLARDDRGRTLISNDLEYMIRFSLNKVKNKNIDYIGYNYLHHENSLTLNDDPIRQQRLMEDKIFIAKKFLNEQEQIPISQFWQKTFKKWIKKYRAKLVVSNLKIKNYQEAKINLFHGLKESGYIGFLLFLMKSLFRK